MNPPLKSLLVGALLVAPFWIIQDVTVSRTPTRSRRFPIPTTWSLLAYAILADEQSSDEARTLARLVIEASETSDGAA